MVVVGYIRVSTAGQIDKYGIDAQRADIERYCSSRGWEIVRWYIDKGVSGVADVRPEFDQLLYSKEVQNPPIEGVVVGKSDRIARDIEKYYAYKHQLKTKGITLYSVAEDFGSAGMFQPILEAMMAAMAEVERHTITARTSGGRAAKAAVGGYAGGNTPYGYRSVSGSLIIWEPEAKMVRELFALRRKGVSYQKILDRFNKEGYRTRKGTEFCLNGIVSIAKNVRFYRGEYKYGDGIWVKGQHEPLLKEE